MKTIWLNRLRTRAFPFTFTSFSIFLANSTLTSPAMFSCTTCGKGCNSDDVDFVRAYQCQKFHEGEHQVLDDPYCEECHPAAQQEMDDSRSDCAFGDGCPFGCHTEGEEEGEEEGEGW